MKTRIIAGLIALALIFFFRVAFAEENSTSASGIDKLPNIRGSIVWPDCDELFFVRFKKPTIGKPTCVEFLIRDAHRMQTAYIKALETQGWSFCGGEANVFFFKRNDERLMLGGVTKEGAQIEKPPDDAYGVFLFVLVPKGDGPCP